MKQLMNNKARVQPLLVNHETEVAATTVTHPIEYSEDLMILIINKLPAILRDDCNDVKATKVTFVKHETTDDE